MTIGDMATATAPPSVAAPRGFPLVFLVLTRTDDNTYRYGVHHVRYVWPAETDLMARLAGSSPSPGTPTGPAPPHG